MEITLAQWDKVKDSVHEHCKHIPKSTRDRYCDHCLEAANLVVDVLDITVEGDEE